jgi:hypothetical protein
MTFYMKLYINSQLYVCNCIYVYNLNVASHLYARSICSSENICIFLLIAYGRVIAYICSILIFFCAIAFLPLPFVKSLVKIWTETIMEEGGATEYDLGRLINCHTAISRSIEY